MVGKAKEDGTKVVTYRAKENICHQGEILGNTRVELARGTLWIYEVLLHNDNVAEFYPYEVFSKDDFDDGELLTHNYVQFEHAANDVGVNPQVAIKMIVEALKAM